MTIPRAFVPVALVATLLTSAVCIAAPANTPRSDDCLAAPNSAAPSGSRWYYRLDRGTQRKCWYMRPAGQAAQQVHPPAPAALLHSTPANSGPSPATEGAPISATIANTAWPPASAEIPAVNSTIALANRATAENTVHQSAQEENTQSIPPPPPSQAHTSTETGVPTGTPAPTTATTSNASADRPDDQSGREEKTAQIPDPSAASATMPQETSAPTAAPTAWAPLIRTVPSDSPAANVSDEARRIVRGDERTNSANTPLSSLLILALALAVLGILSRGVAKLIAARRAPIITDDPDLDPYNDPGDPYNDPEFYRKLREGRPA
jgi:hypothetical protein